MFRNKLIVTTVFLTAALGFAATGNALAATCKGMEKPACESTAGCYWVDPYKRKDGVSVSGHCRGKPGNKKGSGDGKGDKKGSTGTSGSGTSGSGS
ncbi:hypothetical protein [Thiorhodovibrio frisius]|uniref:Integral membrane protein n=1 Tax=Thiorhodovibrio frisius TaxID=631362 RepID=H8YZI6_9GAMM|nr:hypothetical protein [Thiorhodovibrio frisius]EIC22113.1 hypothetical protein Thi970DRAFT_02361 [Thiorhodovibrio frisius]WPL24406.1 hypothetical protein Thiofri_04625 [Thiorhodovibrio frisius]